MSILCSHGIPCTRQGFWWYETTLVVIAMVPSIFAIRLSKTEPRTGIMLLLEMAVCVASLREWSDKCMCASRADSGAD